VRLAASHLAGLENNMNAKRGVLCISAIWALVFVLLTLAACGTLPETAPAPAVAVPLGTPVETSAQATLEAALIQGKNNADNQAAATAEIVRTYAQATLNSANATLSAAQTQQQDSTDVIVAQIAAAAEIVRAHAQATLVAAGSTQSAALTQDAIRQTQVQEQQNKDAIAAGTQTVVANLIATQTRSEVATSQWYADQSRQREEQRQGLIAILWTWCLPVFAVLFAGLCLWGFWRWMKIQQNRQHIAGHPIDKMQAPVDPDKPQDRFLPPESDIVNGRYRLTQPDEQMRGWLDEIKRKLINREKDDDDNSDG
jgi:HAMP domain-containing protein